MEILKLYKRPAFVDVEIFGCTDVLLFHIHTDVHLMVVWK